MATATLSEVVTELRDLTSVPAQGPDKITDPTIQTLISRQLSKFSSYLPRRAISYITSTTRIQTYTLPTVAPDPQIARPNWIFKVFDTSVGNLSADAFVFDNVVVAFGQPSIDPYGSDPSMSFYMNPSLYEGFLQQLGNLRRIIGRTYTYNAGTGELVILPTPISTQKYYFVAGYVWTLALLPEHYYPIFLDFCQAALMKIYATKVARLAGASMAGGMEVTKNFKFVAQYAEELRVQAERAANQQALIEGLPYS